MAEYNMICNRLTSSCGLTSSMALAELLITTALVKVITTLTLPVIRY